MPFKNGIGITGASLRQWVAHQSHKMCSIQSDSLWPHGLQPIRFLYRWNFPGKNTEVGCHFLLQRIFPTQGWTQVSYISCTGWWILYYWDMDYLTHVLYKVKKAPKGILWRMSPFTLVLPTIHWNCSHQFLASPSEDPFLLTAPQLPTMVYQTPVPNYFGFL